MEEIHGWLDACTAFAIAWTGAALYNREHGMTSRMLNVCKAHDLVQHGVFLFGSHV